MRDVSVYQRHGQEFPKLNSAGRVGITTWTMEKTVEDLERARKRQDTGNQPVARASEEEDGETTTVRALVPTQGAPAASQEDCGPLLTVKSRDQFNSKGSMGSDLSVILQEQQQ